MNTIEAIVLGVVQGLTEFLPVSSSGHDVLAHELLGVHLGDDQKVAWVVLTHLASALAILVFLVWDLRNLPWRKPRPLATASGNGESAAPDAAPAPDATAADTAPPVQPTTFLVRWAWFLGLATVPAGLVYVLLKDHIESAFSSTLIVGVALLANGTMLMIVDRMKPSGTRHVHDAAPTSRAAVPLVLVGVAQALAIIPGLSRSGLTISTGLVGGLERSEAVRFSFYLGLVAILGATAVKAEAILSLTEVLGTANVVAGFAGSFVVSLAALWLLLALVRGMKLWGFAVYCWLAGAVAIVWWAM